MGKLTVLKASSVPLAKTSKIPCAIPRNMLSPAALTFVGGHILVDSSILGSTPRINFGSMKCFDVSEFTQSWKPLVFLDKVGCHITNDDLMPGSGEYDSSILSVHLFSTSLLQHYCPQRTYNVL